MNAERAAAIRTIAQKEPVAFSRGPAHFPELFGAPLFGPHQMRSRLPQAAYKALRPFRTQAQALGVGLAD